MAQSTEYADLIRSLKFDEKSQSAEDFETIKQLMCEEVVSWDRFEPMPEMTWFDPALIPPQYLGRFERFLQGTVERIAPPEFQRSLRFFLWNATVERQGLVGAMLVNMNIAFDGDDKDVRRGLALHAGELHDALFNGRADVSEILVDALLTPDVDEWKRYSYWYGVLPAAYVRWLAIKLMPYYAPAQLPPLAFELLDDEVLPVRWHAALHIAERHPTVVDNKTVDRLTEALVHPTGWGWIASSKDYYDDFLTGTGKYRVLNALKQLGTAAAAAAPCIQSLLEDGSRDALTSVNIDGNMAFIRACVDIPEERTRDRLLPILQDVLAALLGQAQPL